MKEKIYIQSAIEKTKKADGSKYYIYKDVENHEYLSKEKLPEGSVEVIKTASKDGKTIWISTEEKKEFKPFKQFPPKKDYGLIECSLKIVGHLEDCKIIGRPTTEDMLFDHIKRVSEKIKGLL